jgi:hypothetical protein
MLAISLELHLRSHGRYYLRLWMFQGLSICALRSRASQLALFIDKRYKGSSSVLTSNQ